MNARAALALALLAALVTAPAHAFEVRSLEVAVSPSGTAEVAVTYDLSTVEQFVARAVVAAPGRVAEQALSALSGRHVRVREVGRGAAAFTVPRFVAVYHARDGTVYATPAVDFRAFGRALEAFWFAPLVAPDFSPDRLSLTFPDGATERFDGATGLPAVTHRT